MVEPMVATVFRVQPAVQWQSTWNSASFNCSLPVPVPANPKDEGERHTQGLEPVHVEDTDLVGELSLKSILPYTNRYYNLLLVINWSL